MQADSARSAKSAGVKRAREAASAESAWIIVESSDADVAEPPPAPEGPPPQEPEIPQPPPPAETMHVYLYDSAQVPWNATLTLRENHVTGARQCCFMTKGHVSDDHGSWSYLEDRGILSVHFNYRWHGDQALQGMPLHPTIVYKDDDNGRRWVGDDDKGYRIEMIWVRSMARQRGQGSWSHTTALGR